MRPEPRVSLNALKVISTVPRMPSKPELRVNSKERRSNVPKRLEVKTHMTELETLTRPEPRVSLTDLMSSTLKRLELKVVLIAPRMPTKPELRANLRERRSNALKPLMRPEPRVSLSALKKLEVRTHMTELEILKKLELRVNLSALTRLELKASLIAPRMPMKPELRVISRERKSNVPKRLEVKTHMTELETLTRPEPR